MPSFNQVTLIGHLTRDPEMKYTPKGTAIAEIGLAVNRTFEGANGDKLTHPTENMKKYRLYAQVTGSKFLGEVEAESEEEAIRKGFDHPEAHISFCHHCSVNCEDASVAEIIAETDDES